LVRGIDAQTRHLRPSPDCILVLAQKAGHLLIQVADLLLEESQPLQRRLQKPSVLGFEPRARAERIAQLFRCGTQFSIGQGGQSRWVGFPVGRCFQHASCTGDRQIRF
jgi:hypothetical protein